MLDPSVGGVVDAHSSQTGGDPILNGVHEGFVLLLVSIQIVHDAFIVNRFQIPR